MTHVGEGERMWFIIASVVLIVVINFTEYAYAIPGINIIAGLLSNPISLIAILVIANTMFPRFGMQIEKVIAIMLVAYSALGVLIILDYPLFSLVGIAITLLVTSLFFSFYQSSDGDVGSMLITTLFVSALVYMAMGPWSPIVRKNIQVIKEPINAAMDMAKERAEEMSLLISNPAAYYARMQAKNAVPDDVEPPKGVEFRAIYPPRGGVWGEETASEIVIENYGEAEAKDVKIEFYCEKFRKRGISGEIVIDQCEPSMKTLMSKPSMKRKEVEVVSNSFVPKPVFKNEKSVQENLNLFYKLSYRYSTETNFQISISNPDTLKSYLSEGVDLRTVEPSYVENAPAVLSLNAGLQPKYGGREYQFIISVIKQRYDGKLILDDKTSAEVWVEKAVSVEKPDCKSNLFSVTVGEEEIEGKQFWKITVKPSETIQLEKSDIVYTSCRLKAPMPESFKTITGIVLGKLNNFYFEKEEKQMITVSRFGDSIPMEYFVSYWDEIEKKIKEGKEKAEETTQKTINCVKDPVSCTESVRTKLSGYVSDVTSTISVKLSEKVNKLLIPKRKYYLYATKDVSLKDKPEGNSVGYVKVSNGKAENLEYAPAGSFLGEATASMLLTDSASVPGLKVWETMLWTKIKTWDNERGISQRYAWVHIGNGLIRLATNSWEDKDYFVNIYQCPAMIMEEARIKSQTYMLDESDINEDWMLSTSSKLKRISSGNIKALGDFKCIVIDSDVYLFARVDIGGDKNYVAVGTIREPGKFIEITKMPPQYEGYPDARFIPASTRNYQEAWNRDIEYIVIHYTAGLYEDAISLFSNNYLSNPVSAHYIISKEGNIVQMVEEKDIAYHAGCQLYDPKCNLPNINQLSIGIEVENYGYEVDRFNVPKAQRFICNNQPYLTERQKEECKYYTEWDPYTDQQMEALARLVGYLAAKYNIPVDRKHIIGHDEVYYGKMDPGPAFNWDEFIQMVRDVKATYSPGI